MICGMISSYIDENDYKFYVRGNLGKNRAICNSGYLFVSDV